MKLDLHLIYKYLKHLLAALALFIVFLPVFVSAQSNSNFIPSKTVICGGSCPVLDGDFSFTRAGIATFILSLARFLTYVGAALAVLFIVYGGILLITDLGGGKRAEAGWNCIKTSIIGLVIVILAYTIVAFIGNILNTNILEGFTVI